MLGNRALPPPLLADGPVVRLVGAAAMSSGGLALSVVRGYLDGLHRAGPCGHVDSVLAVMQLARLALAVVVQRECIRRDFYATTEPEAPVVVDADLHDSAFPML